MDTLINLYYYIIIIIIKNRGKPLGGSRCSKLYTLLLAERRSCRIAPNEGVPGGNSSWIVSTNTIYFNFQYQ